jgi:hypothetical protein
LTDSIEVRTELSADEFSLQYDGEEQLTPAERRNGLGVCPYALVRQRAVPDSPFGLHAYAGSEQAVHALNYGASELGSSVWDVIYPTWFATGGGKLPDAPWALDKSKLVYVQTAAGTPPPTMDPMVPSVPLAAALAYLQQTADWLLSAQPELVWAAIRLLAGNQRGSVGPRAAADRGLRHAGAGHVRRGHRPRRANRVVRRRLPRPAGL